jgi:hypothetical protein
MFRFKHVLGCCSDAIKSAVLQHGHLAVHLSCGSPAHASAAGLLS